MTQFGCCDFGKLCCNSTDKSDCCSRIWYWPTCNSSFNLCCNSRLMYVIPDSVCYILPYDWSSFSNWYLWYCLSAFRQTCKIWVKYCSSEFQIWFEYLIFILPLNDLCISKSIFTMLIEVEQNWDVFIPKNFPQKLCSLFIYFRRKNARAVVVNRKSMRVALSCQCHVFCWLTLK